MSDSIYLGRDGHQLGPYSWAQIAAMASAAQIRRDDLAWHGGMPQWEPAHAVLERLGMSVPGATPQIPLAGTASAASAAPAAGLLGGLAAAFARKRK